MAIAADLKQRLERKATFEAAVKELTAAVQAPSSQPAAAEALELVPRVHTLLKARYSNPAFWSAGLGLFRAAQVCSTAVLYVCMLLLASPCATLSLLWGLLLVYSSMLSTLSFAAPFDSTHHHHSPACTCPLLQRTSW
jgi:hypothetical protein